MNTATLFLSCFAAAFIGWTALMVGLHFLFMHSSAKRADKEQLQRRRIRRHIFRLP